jgi:hypothetical protein
MLCQTLFVVQGVAQTNTFPTSGNAGIGTTSPGAFALAIARNNNDGGATDAPAVSLKNTNTTSPSGSGYNIAWANFIAGNGAVISQFGANYGTGAGAPWNGGSGFYITTRTDHPIVFATGSTTSEKLRIANDGNVGIGTASPQTKLHITAGTPAFRIEDSNGSNASFYSNYLDYAQLSINRNPSTGTFLNTGKAAAQLSIYGGSGDGHFEFYTSNSNNTAPTEKMRITGSGNVGIGTSTPSYTLDVVGSIKGNYIELNNGDADGGRLLFRSAGNNEWRIRNFYGSLGFFPGEGEPTAFYIASSGYVGIGTTNPQSKLAVNGEIYGKKVKVTQSGWSDYVFYPGYRLRPLSEVEQFIIQQRHLPEVPSADEVEKDGIDLGDNQATLLKKIEELTLYLIEQNKRLNAIEKKLQQLSKVK